MNDETLSSERAVPPSFLRSHRSDLAAILFLAVVTTIYFADVLFGSQRFFIRDLTRYYYPTKRVIREVMQSGEFPYWNPYYSAGQPMAANPEYEIFYPLQLLILLPDYDLGFRLHILVHYYIATFGFYLLLRSMGLRIAGSLLGAIAIGLGGLYMGLGNLLPILFPAAWLPWVLIFTRRFFLRPNLRDFSLAALFLGMQHLIGEPTTILQTWVLIGAYGLYRAWYDPLPFGRVLRRNLFGGILLVIAGAAVGAAQMLPAIDHVADSARSRPFTFDLVTAWSMPFARPLELLFPNIFGHIYISGRGTWFWAGGMYEGMGSPFLFSIYFGLLPALAVLCAWFVRQRGAGLVLLISIGSALLALGRNTPLYHWLYEARIATSIRYPEKFAFMGLLACAILAAVMFDRILSGDRRVQRTMFHLAAAVSVVAVIIALFSTTSWYSNLYLELWGQTKSPNRAAIVAISREDWWIAAARCAVAVVLCWMIVVARRVSNPRLQGISAALLIAFVTIDLVPTQFNVLPRVHRRFFREPPAAQKLDPDRSQYRVFHEVDWYGSSEIARKYFGTGDAVYWVVRNGVFPMTPASWGVRTVLERDYDKTHLHSTIDLTQAMWDLKNAGRKDWREIFAAMSNARYHTEYREFEPERKRVRGRFKTAEPVNFIRGQDPPRYYFADQLVRIGDPREFVKKLTDQTFSRKVAFVSFPAFAAGKGIIHSARETPNTVTLELDAQTQAFLVLSITPHKYWRATLDDASIPLHRTNIGYQGVVVPPGRHILRMRYRNTLIPIGAAVSLGSISVLIFGAWRQRSGVHETLGWSAQGRRDGHTED